MEYTSTHNHLQNFDKILSVTQLCAEIKNQLTKQIGLVKVVGEISNVTKAYSGHTYFTIKDNQSQIKCVFFKQYNINNLLLTNGMQVQISGQINLYEPRGDLQINIYRLELAGSGALQIQFEKLKKKLLAERLFASEQKKPMPPFIKKIALITSNKGAAVHDFCTVANKRFPLTQIYIYDTLVQGNSAPAQIIKALNKADKANLYDVIVLTRGGGSIEDLWAFNNEELARTIFNCQTPVISAIGHEIDFSISDFVADARAPTPSAAAEMLTPEQYELTQKIDHLSQSLTNYLQHIIITKKHQLAQIQKQLIHPKDQVILQKQKLAHLKAQLSSSMVSAFEQKIAQLTQLKTSLNIISPKQTLARGYAIINKTSNHNPITSAQDLSTNQKINIIMHDGTRQAIINK